MNLKFSPIKILIFLAVFINTLNAFDYQNVLDVSFPSSTFKTDPNVELLGVGYLKYKNKIYSYDPNAAVFPFSVKISKYSSDAYYKFSGEEITQIQMVVPGSRIDTLWCQDINDREKYNWSTSDCLGPGQGPATYSAYYWTKVEVGYAFGSLVRYVTTCKANENFNTQTKKCEAPCGKGQSWDQENNKCYIDCTDKAKNMWGYPDGSCMDCSKEKTYIGAAKCICKYFGKKFTPPAKVEGLQPVNGIPIGNGYYRETCDDGTQFDFKSPGEGNDEAPKYDNNSTQIGQDDGNKTKPQDQNASNPSNPKDKNKDKDNNKTSPKDPTTPNQNGNQTATPANPADPNGSNNGGGSNSGSNNNKNESNGRGDHGIPNGDPKGNDYDGLKYDSDSFRLDDIESDVKGFSDSILKRYDEFMVNFSGFKDEYNRLMGLFKGESTFESFIKPNQVNSCPRSFSIKISSFRSENITIDICENLSKVRPALYSIFYIVFFIAFLYLIIKFSLRLFSNPFRVI